MTPTTLLSARCAHGSRPEHWPPDLPPPEDVYCEITLTTGEQWTAYLGREGHLDPADTACHFASRLVDDRCETHMGWAQQVRAAYKVLPARQR